MEADFDKTSLRFTLLDSFEPASHTGSNAAQMAELVDALGSGPSGGNTVEVRVLFWAPCHAGAAQTPSFVFNGHEGADLNLQVPYIVIQLKGLNNPRIVCKILTVVIGYSNRTGLAPNDR